MVLKTNYVTFASYNTMKKLYEDGNINQETWAEYCEKIIEKLIEDNKDVFDYLEKV